MVHTEGHKTSDNSPAHQLANTHIRYTKLCAHKVTSLPLFSAVHSLTLVIHKQSEHFDIKRESLVGAYMLHDELNRDSTLVSLPLASFFFPSSLFFSSSSIRHCSGAASRMQRAFRHRLDSTTAIMSAGLFESVRCHNAIDCFDNIYRILSCFQSLINLFIFFGSEHQLVREVAFGCVRSPITSRAN